MKRFLRSQGFDVLSTRADVLRDLARRGCRFAEMLLEYRRLCHDPAFLENWLMHLHSTDNRMHSTYYQLRSSTGRLSSCRPCAQQIPRRGNDVAAIRKLFRVSWQEESSRPISQPLSYCIMAYLSGDETMRKALQEGQDLHKLTASKISGLAIEQVTDQQRQAAKTINFLAHLRGIGKDLAVAGAIRLWSRHVAGRGRRKCGRDFSRPIPGIRPGRIGK